MKNTTTLLIAALFAWTGCTSPYPEGMEETLKMAGKNLIADVDMPKNFKIAGYIKPYYYSQAIIDEEKEEMTVFKFKLQ